MKESQKPRSARPKNRAAFFPSLKDHLIFWPIVAGGVALDLWTKKAIFTWLYYREDPTYTVIPGFFRLILQENPGAAFGIAPGKRIFLTSVSAIAIAVVLYIFFTNKTKQLLVKLALPLFLAGILGNLYDRLFNDGAVRDFLDVYYEPIGHWPTFNVADSMLCIAVGLMIIATLTAPKKR